MLIASISNPSGGQGHSHGTNLSSTATMAARSRNGTVIRPSSTLIVAASPSPPESRLPQLPRAEPLFNAVGTRKRVEHKCSTPPQPQVNNKALLHPFCLTLSVSDHTLQRMRFDSMGSNIAGPISRPAGSHGRHWIKGSHKPVSSRWHRLGTAGSGGSGRPAIPNESKMQGGYLPDLETEHETCSN